MGSNVFLDQVSSFSIIHQGHNGAIACKFKDERLSLWCLQVSQKTAATSLQKLLTLEEHVANDG
jgi:hypothetical protein